MIKVGLIGVGFMGGTHALCYESLLGKEDFKVTAVADKDPERARKAAQKFGAKIFSSGEELINSGEANTVDICLPTYMHAEHAIMAMEKGCNVIMEKPVCLLESEAEKLLEVQKKTGAKVMAAQCIRFWSEYVYLKKIIDEKTYGKVINAVFKRISPLPAWSWERWLMDPDKSGSAALDLHIHDVDYVRYIMGWPNTVKSEATCTKGNNEHIFSLYKYDDAVVSIEGGWDYPSCFPFEMAYRVRFEEATVVFSSSGSPCVKVYCEDGCEIVPVIENDFESESEGLEGNISSLGGYYNEIKYFLECLNKGEDLKTAPLKEGVESFKLVLKGIDAASR